MTAPINNAPPAQNLQVAKPGANYDLEQAFTKGVAERNQYLKMAEDANHVGFFGGIWEHIDSNAKARREDKVSTLRNANDLVEKIMEAMAHAFEQENARTA
jgi:hypothetical protein